MTGILASEKIAHEQFQSTEFLKIDHEESVPPEEEKNSWHGSSAGLSAKGNVGSQAGRFQLMTGLGREGTGT